MRKWFVPLLIFLVLFFGAVYLLIPNTIAFKASTNVSFSAKAFSRALFNEATWKQWWPGNGETNSTPSPRLLYNGNSYTVIEKKLSSMLIAVANGKDTLLTELILIPIKSDSIELEWLGAANTSLNPISRIQKMRWARSINEDLGRLLQKMKPYYTTVAHIYSIPIQKTIVLDSILISTSFSSAAYPTTELIYGLIDKLKAFAKKNGAKQSGLPMLNITGNRDNTYLTKVALPVDKKLQDEGDIRYRWMLGGGNILVTEVKGGPQQIEKAFAALEKYISDFNRVAPAIPFQSLVTDRRAEPDTSKWVTKVYWPVM